MSKVLDTGDAKTKLRETSDIWMFSSGQSKAYEFRQYIE